MGRKVRWKPSPNPSVCPHAFPGVTVFGEVARDYTLIRAEDDLPGHGLKRGDYALVCEYPHSFVAFVLPTKPLVCPTLEMGRDEYRAIADDDPRIGRDHEFGVALELIRPAFLTDPGSGYDLTKACIEAGWDRRPLLCWLVDRMGRMIEEVEGG